MAKYLLTEDPGIRGAGVALFDMSDKTLCRAAYVRSPCRTGNMATECRAVALAIKHWVGRGFEESDFALLGAEWPRMLPPGKQKGDQNDLPGLSGVSSAFAAMYPNTPVRSYYPRDWKGTVEPDVMIRRVHGRLTETELLSVEWEGKSRDPTGGMMHNVFDGIGIGLHILGRLERVRSYSFED